MALLLLAGAGCHAPAVRAMDAWRRRLDALLGKCAGNDAASCLRAALMFRNGPDDSSGLELTPRRIQAQQLSARACDLGSVVGCNDLGVSLNEGWGAPRDAARATELFADTCVGGAAIGCLNRAQLADDGFVPEPLASHGFALLAAACRAGLSPTRDLELSVGHPNMSVCLVAGRMQQAGKGVLADEWAARALFAADQSSEGAWLARAADGEACTYGCRGGSDHTSRCVDGRCASDVPIGADCSAGHGPCTFGAFCGPTTHTCAAWKRLGEACQVGQECYSGGCEARQGNDGRCVERRVRLHSQ